MSLPGFIHHSPALQDSRQPAPFDYGRALSLREMARHYTELPKYLLAPEVSALLHYLPDWEQHALINTLWNTGARLNEALALRRRDFHLSEAIPHVVIRTAKQRRTAGGRPKKAKVRTGWCRCPIRRMWMRCADYLRVPGSGLRKMRTRENGVPCRSGG